MLSRVPSWRSSVAPSHLQHDRGVPEPRGPPVAALNRIPRRAAVERAHDPVGCPRVVAPTEHKQGRILSARVSAAGRAGAGAVSSLTSHATAVKSSRLAGRFTEGCERTVQPLAAAMGRERTRAKTSASAPTVRWTVGRGDVTPTRIRRQTNASPAVKCVVSARDLARRAPTARALWQRELTQHHIRSVASDEGDARNQDGDVGSRPAALKHGN